MIFDYRRKLRILIGCMTILEESDNTEDIIFAVQNIIKMEQLTGEIYIEIDFSRRPIYKFYIH